MDRYYVKEEDLKKYLAKSPSERSREIPVGVFSSRKENSLPLDMGGRDHNNVNIVLTSNERAMFIHLLEKRMEIYPDAMDINRVAKIGKRGIFLRYGQVFLQTTDNG